VRLDNRTRYDTRTLRKFLIAVFRAQSPSFQARVPQWRRLKVLVSYSRPGDAGWDRKAHLYEALGQPAMVADVRRRQTVQRRRHVSGCAFIQGSWANLRLPSKEVDAHRVAAVWVHELWHVAGSVHADFPESVMRCHLQPFYWVAELFGPVLTEAAPKPKPVRDLAAIRRARVEARLAGWESRLRRAQKTVAKLKRQVHYYDRREKLAAGKAYT
jgi:hypothetical protein